MAAPLNLRGASQDAAPRATAYSYYLLALLICANTLNYLDRTILSILAERIKADLHVSDASLGFLYGTAFAVCFAVFAIPMGRLADQWRRTRLLGLGILLWSGMTALTGLAANFAQLAAARVLVGVGEATSVPAQSLIPDLFERRRRGGAMGVYLASIALGSGAALLLGGFVLQAWDSLCGGGCSLAGWRVAFLVAGAPGLVIGLLLFLAREPARGAMDGQAVDVEKTRTPFRLFLSELAAVIPPFALFHLRHCGGRRAVLVNLGVGATIAASAWGLSRALGDPAQWIGMAVGVYAAISLFQSLWLRDRPVFRMTLGSPAFAGLTVGMAMLVCMVTAMTFWATPYAMRTFDLSPAAAGLRFGLTTIGCAVCGMILGGLLTDRWRRRDLRGGLWIALICLPLVVIMGLMMFLTRRFEVYFAGFVIINLVRFTPAAGVALHVQELVIPRMRSQAAAIFGISVTIFTFAVGPYAAGKISEMTGSLSTGLLSLLLLAPIAGAAFWISSRHLIHAETYRVERARAAGESV